MITPQPAGLALARRDRHRQSSLDKPQFLQACQVSREGLEKPYNSQE
jgi:hypothetical protein